MSGWETVPLREVVAETQYGTSQKANEQKRGLPILRMNNVTRTGQIDLSDLKHVEIEPTDTARYTVRRGDLLFNRTNSPDLVGKMAMWDRDDAIALAGYLVRVRLHLNKADPKFVAAWFNTPEMKAQLRTRAKPSINMSNISASELLKFPIPLPPLAEQRRIAAILDQAEALRAKRRAALARLDTFTQSLFLDVFGDPANNPRSFPRKTLGEMIQFIGGSQPPRSVFKSEDGKEMIRLVQIRDFKTDRFKTFIHRKLARRYFEVDDVMIGRYGPPVFQILRGLSGSYNVALMKAVPLQGVTKDFVFHLLQAPGLHNFVVANSKRTAGQTGVNLDLLENFSAFQPPMVLQEEFSMQAAAVDRLKTAQRASLAKLDELFDSLQHRAFRGEL